MLFILLHFLFSSTLVDLTEHKKTEPYKFSFYIANNIANVPGGNSRFYINEVCTTITKWEKQTSYDEMELIFRTNYKDVIMVVRYFNDQKIFKGGTSLGCILVWASLYLPFF